MTRPRIYLETTIVGYLTALPTRDLVTAALQQVTRDWWASRGAYDLFVSQLVIDEAATGDPVAAGRRLEALREVPVLETTEDAVMLGKALIDGGAVPPKAAADALHIGVAAAHGLDYLVTWNCTHIANAALRGKIEAICRASGFEPPVICTPVELTEE